MESKYYIPLVEEFHIGFECEIKVFDSEEYVKTIYSTITDEIFCKDSNGNIWTNDTIRVKYLDQEDIESLGWVHRYNDFSFGEFYKKKDSKKDYHLSFNYPTQSLIIGIYNKEDTEFYNDIFNGIVKNKSELKKLLKQLNIE